MNQTQLIDNLIKSAETGAEEKALKDLIDDLIEMTPDENKKIIAMAMELMMKKKGGKKGC